MKSGMDPTVRAMLSPSQQFVVDSFNFQTFDPNQLDVQNEPIYDTITVTAGNALNAVTSSFFTNVGPSSSKLLNATNLLVGATLQAPEAFSIFGIRLAFSEDVFRADLLSILNGFAFQIFLANKAYNTAPLRHYSAGMGIWATTTKTNESEYQNGQPHRESMHKLAIKIVIESNMRFNAVFVGNSFSTSALGTGCTILCELDGLHARGVQ